MTEPAIDTGEILEALNDKVDRDCRNVDTTSGADVVIEWQAPTAENGYTWYRKYKSGWIEQGGIINNSSSSASVTFTKTFKNTNYYICAHQLTNNVSTIGNNYQGQIYKETTGFTIGPQGQADNKIQSVWEAKGFAAQS